MKKILLAMLIVCMLPFATVVSAAEPIQIPEIPNADGALIFSHDFENSGFNNLLPKGGTVKYTDSGNNSYSYKTGSEPVITVVDGNGGKVLRFDGSGGSDTYTIIAPSSPINQRVVVSFDVMTDTIPGAGGRKEILKIGETLSPQNRAIDFLSDGGIYSNGVRFADYPNYEVNKWYHFDLIIGFGDTEADRNVIVQLSVDGQSYRQDYTHSATFNQLASMRFATKANFGSIYIDNLKLYKDVPSSYVIDTQSGIKLLNNTDIAKDAVFIATLYENEGSGLRLKEIYSEQVNIPSNGTIDITNCNIVKPADTNEITYTMYYKLWDFGNQSSKKIDVLVEKQD